MSTFRYITVNRPLSSDLHTPVSAYLKLRDSSVKSILMESSDYHTGSNARSFIAIEPIAEVSVSHGVGICSFPDGTVTERKIGPDFTVDELIARAALRRQESRGGHYRTDYPEKQAAWAHHVLDSKALAEQEEDKDGHDFWTGRAISVMA
jgi:anthranilate synthase component 1